MHRACVQAAVFLFHGFLTTLAVAAACIYIQSCAPQTGPCKALSKMHKHQNAQSESREVLAGKSICDAYRQSRTAYLLPEANDEQGGFNHGCQAARRRNCLGLPVSLLMRLLPSPTTPFTPPQPHRHQMNARTCRMHCRPHGLDEVL